MAIKVNPEAAPLCVLKALALSLAREIDKGEPNLRGELERVMSLIPDAREGLFR